MSIPKMIIWCLSLSLFLQDCKKLKKDDSSIEIPNSYTSWIISEDSALFQIALFPTASLTDIKPPQDDSIVSSVAYRINKNDSSMIFEDEYIYLNPIQKASFPNGDEALNLFIDSLQKMQGNPAEGSIEWVYPVAFIVDAEGIIKKKGMIWGHQKLYVEPCMHIMSKMPKWNPAIQNGHKVASFNIVRIKFNVK